MKIFLLLMRLRSFYPNGLTVLYEGWGKRGLLALPRLSEITKGEPTRSSYIVKIYRFDMWFCPSSAVAGYYYGEWKFCDLSFEIYGDYHHICYRN